MWMLGYSSVLWTLFGLGFCIIFCGLCICDCVVTHAVERMCELVYECMVFSGSPNVAAFDGKWYITLLQNSDGLCGVGLQMSIMTRLYPCKQCAEHFKEVLK